ncbi:hypothetical protein [Neomegalonema sp.]|uniref:hypothetical protein n=1 Tax=Neomegalonema sp. TaxID=2039713 RepID=UPI00261E231E|nr:hypothetical protein [Neomegalonema sp.]MDD2867263.1 hypothetical protein [Neomegalonema sp.]
MTIVMEQGSDANEQLRMVIDLARENPEVFRPDGVGNPNGRWLWLQERRSSGSAAPPRVRRLRDFIGSTLGALREDEQVETAQKELEDGVRNRLHQIQGFLEANPPAHAARPFTGASPTTGSRAEGRRMAEEAEAAFVSYLAAENIALHEQLDEARERRGRELKDKRDDFALSPLQFDPGVANPMRGAVAAQIKLVAEAREACVRRARERRNEIASVLGAEKGELSPRQKSAVGAAVEKLRAAARQMPPSPGFVLSIAAIPFLYLALLGGAGFQSTLRWASVNQPPNLQDLRQAGYVVAGCLAIFMVLVALILMRRIRKARMVFEETRIQTINEIQDVANLAAKDVVAMEEYELLRGGAVLLQDLREALSRTDAARIDEVTREIEKLLDIDLASSGDGGARGLLGNGLPPEEWVRDLIRQWRGTQTTSPGGGWRLHVESAARAQKYNEKMLDEDGIISQAISFPSSWRADDTTLYATPLKPLSSAEASS